MGVLATTAALIAALWSQNQTRADIRTLDQGIQSRIQQAQQVIARTPDEWLALWQMHAAMRKPPAVDFQHEMVVGIFGGRHPTAGFWVEIVNAEFRDGTLTITYRETSPPPGALTAQVLTSPYHIVAVPAAAGEVQFENVR